MATITPVSPPSTKIASAPATNSIGRPRTTFPIHTVAMKQRIWMPVGIATASLAAEKNPSEICGRPVVNMWCTQRPKLRKATPTAESTIQLWPTIGRRAKAGSIVATSATEGRKMM